MQAAVFQRYGPPEVLRVEEVQQPAPREDEVLVRVHASSATRSDCGFRSAEYFVSRFGTGLLRPRRGRVGIEFAGEVEAVGRGVRSLAAGDRVFGIASGTNAEYVCVRGSGVVAPIPDGVSYVEAAGVADGALSAMSLLRQVTVQEGDRVLVYGASGSIGVGGIQVAKHLGAHVTAVCDGRSVELAGTLGADEVLDFRACDFRKNGKTYDVVLDAVGRQSYLRCRRSLEPDGRYITTDPGFMWHDALVSLCTKRARLGIVRYRREDMVQLADLLATGRYRPVIDRTYPLERVIEAHRYVDTHQKVGNVVITVP